MRRVFQSALLAAYRIVFARGLMRFDLGHRLFLAAYEFYKGTFEAGQIRALRAHAPAGALVIDVGANVGFFTERFARWVGPAGRVIAIEPEAANFAQLERRLRRTNLGDRIELHRAVADADAGTAALIVNPDHPGDHRMGLGDRGESGVSVPAVTLDGVASGTRPVTLVKIDVQGAEKRVLTGGERLLARHRPALFVELDPAALARFGSGVDDILAYLAARGYRPHRLGKTGAVACSPAEIGATVARRGYTDILFLPRVA